MLNAERTQVCRLLHREASALGDRHWLLSVVPAGHPPTPASTPETVSNAVDRIGHGPVGWACEVGHAMASHIIDQIPEFGGGPAPFETLRMCTESAAIGCLLRFVGFTPPPPVSTAELLTGVAEFVQRGIGLDLVLRGVRLGHALLARAFMAACDQLLSAVARTDEMQDISNDMFDYVDAFSEILATTYLAERNRWMSTTAATQSKTVRQILQNQQIDITYAQKILSYEFDRHHVAATLWYESPVSRVDVGELQVVADIVLDRLGAIQKLVVPFGAGHVWAWGSRRQFRSGPVDLEGVTAGHPEVFVAVGDASPGLAGFRRSHGEALTAQRVSRMSRRTSTPRATTYADTAVAGMLTENVEAARCFVRRELGPLAAQTPAVADLRVTLLCYFEEESSPFAAAKQLHVSRNTVGYRVKRASELLGYDVASRRYQLHTALLLADRFGSVLLTEPGSTAECASPAG